MFKKLAADALGLGDIGKVIDRANFDKVDSDDYVMHEDGEEIFFIIKSKKDEYCFTNLGLIHLDGDSAVSSKRRLKRYNFATHAISDVQLETAGTVDLDVEIKFVIGGVPFSIDVDKKQIEPVKDLYKTLLKVSEIMSSNARMLHYSERSLETAKDIVVRVTGPVGSLAEQFAEINKTTFNWLKECHEAYTVKDYGNVFRKYINN